MNDICKWLYVFWISKTALSWLIQKLILLSMNLYHIEGSKAKLWMTFVNDYMLFEYPKQPWVDCYKRSYYFQWTYPILRAPWPSYMNDVCKWLYAFLNVKNNLELTDTKGHIAFNEPIPYWGLHGLAIWMMFVYDYMLFWISKTTLSWLIQKFILLSMNLSHIEVSMA